jgi:hypothetical protein
MALMGFIVLIPIAPALANTPPTRIVTPNVGSYIDTSSCDFAFSVSFDEVLIEVISFDSDGNPLWDTFHFSGTVTATNLANGTTLDIREQVSGRQNIQENFAGSSVGINTIQRLNDGRVVIINVGRLVFDADGNVTFEAGIHFDEDQGMGANRADFCQALAG